ncbi:MAG: tape measure protein [Rhodanobacter sp.]
MPNATFEEAIRLAFETSGTEGIKQAAGIIAGMGDVSEEAKQKAAALLDEIGNVEKSNAAVRQYGEVGKSVLEYGRQITAARAKVIELADAVKASDAPTKAQQRDLDKARSGLKALVAAQQGQLGTLRTLKSSLDAQGISTRSAAASQKDLAARTTAASANLRTMVTDLKRTRDADASLQASLAQAAQKSKTETEQYDAALKKVRAQIDANKTAATTAAAETNAGLSATTGVVASLRSALAGLSVYFSARGILGGIKSILSTGDQFAKYEKQLDSVFNSASKGSEAFAWAKQFAKDTPLTLGEVMQSFIQLKNFGIDPMNGALQAAVDQNAKLGGESERLQRITLAMGQAFAKGALQGQDIKQMIEAGVPVWQLLSEATGKTTAELQKMSEAGKLGKDVMEKFFAQMGKDSAGAAKDQMQLLSGQFSNLQDNLEQFEDRVAKKGVLDFFRDQLSALNDTITGMAKDGRLDVYAQRISDGIVSMAKAARSATAFLVDHAAAIASVVKIYATFKVARIVGELALVGARLAEGATQAGSFARALGRIPGGVKVAIAVVGFDLLVKAGNYIGELAGKHSAAAKSLEATQQRINAEIRKQAESYMEVERQYGRFADTQVLGAADVAKFTAAERASYASRLQGLQAYLSAKASEQRRLQQLGELSQDELDQTLTAVKAAKDGMAALSQGADLAAASLKNKLSTGAQTVRDGLVGIGADATTAQTRVETLFQSFQGDTVTHIGDVALALANIAAESQKADEAVRVGLSGALTQLSSTDLLKFQSAATAAFEQFKVGAEASAAVTESVLTVALQRLGVAADQWGLASTEAARQNSAAFQTVAENASATAGTIEAAFNKALANATTIGAVQDLGTAMQIAGQQGKVGFDATERSAAAVQNRIRSLQTALDPLNASFAQLGITSKRSLDDAAAAARTSFDQIVHAYRGGKAAIEDVRAAFGAYAKTQLDAAANSDDWRQSSVRNSLQVQAATLSVSDEMVKLGLAGADATGKIEHGSRVASIGLRDTASAATDAASATDKAAASAEHYGEQVARAADASARAWVATGQRTGVVLGGLSNTFLQALSSLNQLAVGSQNLWRDRFNATVAQWRSQNAALDEQLQALTKQNGAYDELSKRVEALRKQYNFLNDDQLRALAQAQQTLADNQQRAEDAAAQKRHDAQAKAADELAKQTAQWEQGPGRDANGASGVHAPTTDPQRIAIDLNVSTNQAPGAVPAQLSPTDVQKVANEVVRQIGIARSSSNH